MSPEKTNKKRQTSKLDVTNADNLIFPQIKKLNYLGDTWTFFCFRALMLSNTYKRYTEAIKSKNTSVVCEIEAVFDIKKTFRFWLDLHCVLELLSDELVTDTNSFADLFNGWISVNNTKLEAMGFDSIEFVAESSNIKTSSGFIYCSIPSDTNTNDYFNEYRDEISHIQRKTLNYLNEQLAGLLPFKLNHGRDNLHRLHSTEQRLDVGYLMLELGLDNKQALKEISLSDKDCWRVFNSTLFEAIPSNTSLDELLSGTLNFKGNPLRNELKYISKRYLEASQLIENAVIGKFPSYQK